MKFGRLIKCNKEKCNKLSQTLECALTLSWRRPLSYRNQSIDFQSKKTVSIQLFSLKIGWNFQNCSFTEHLRLRLLQKTNNSLTQWQLTDMNHLTHVRPGFLSYRNQPINLLSKSSDWFLYDRSFCSQQVDWHNGWLNTN